MSEKDYIIGKQRSLLEWQASRIKDLEDKVMKKKRIYNWLWARVVPIKYKIGRIFS